MPRTATFKLTFWKVIFLLLMAGGLYATFIRFTQGLGASTHLSDQFPWGIWISFDVLCGVMLAAGGFTLTAAVHILNIKRLHSIIRPTILTAFLGYILVCAALMFDLGKPYNIWHPLIMRNPHSVMFEVAYCVMLYTTVLALEFSPIVLERFNLQKPLRVVRAILIPLVICGVILSTLHQSSLGTLYLIVPEKLYPLWYTPLLPVFFFLSAIAVGLAMTIFESSMSSKHFGLQLELPVLQELGRVLVVVLGVYAILRFEDLANRGVLKLALHPGYEMYLFWLEISLCIIFPLALLLQPRVRTSANGLYFAAVLVVLGFITNRMNVSITGFEGSTGVRYFPKWTELAVTGSIIAAGFALFGLAVKYLPIFPKEELAREPLAAPGSALESVSPVMSMQETEPTRSRWLRLTLTLSAKLNILLLGAMVVIFALLGYLNVRLHRQHLEQNTLLSAERVSDVIKHSTTEYMLRNDQEGLYHSIRTMAAEPGVEKIRIFDQEGRITYTTDSAEQNHVVDKTAEACYACHAQSQPLARLNRPDRFRIYRNPAGVRVLGIITPIENQPACSNAACHAHPAEQKILGVLDTNLSLAKTDVQVAESSRRLIVYTGCALLLIALLSWFFVWQVVGRPVKALERGTERLAAGDLGYQIEVHSEDEIGELASSFNSMSRQLQSERNENVSWTHTLEERVENKTRELKRAHEHALHTEKMASIGKMAAVLAHEINNPLSGILTYAKLLRKWVDREDSGRNHRKEICESLDLIALESRRCGDLVKNLLTFSRATPMNLQPANLNQVIDRSLRLVQHQLDLAGIQVQPELDPDLPPVVCDAAQIEQVLLVLIMNALDAMPQGGNLWLATSFGHEHNQVRIVVRDDGSGIPSEILPRIFEPFLTTKETGRGVGLGLAISHSILERHNGNIEVRSEPGRGTTFTVTLPWDANSEKIVTSPANEIAATASGR